jgi:hypothetical protein
MLAIIHLPATFVADLFKSRRRREVENLFLRHQLNVALNAPLRRSVQGSGTIVAGPILSGLHHRYARI